ncbi:MAG TPA: hypothetical protein ENJ32_08820, partial [Crenotrichaceae bacterium]|nr:hypothetical protein [Crenotrichaceae bacterium]
MQNILNTFKHYYQTQTSRARILLAITGFIVLLIIARIALPYAVIHTTVSWLNDKGIDANIEDIRIKIISGSIVLKNATGTDNRNHHFTIGDIELFWDWSPLSSKTVQVNRVKLDNIKLDIERYNNATVVSGILFNDSDNNEASTDSGDNEAPETPWGTSLNTIELSDINVCYQQHHTDIDQASDNTRNIDYCLHLSSLSWNGNISHKSDNQLSQEHNQKDEVVRLYYNSNGDFQLNHFAITDNLLQKKLIEIENFQLNDVVIKTLNDIAIASIVFENVSGLQRDDKEHIDTVRTKSLQINDIHFKQLHQLSVADISVNDPGLFIQKDKAGLFTYKKWIHQPNNSNSNGNSNGNTPDPVATSDAKSSPDSEMFSADFGTLSINNADFCYHDQSISTYLCFTQDSLLWAGHGSFDSASHQLTAKGELKFQQTRINNQLENRYLLDLETLAINGIDVQSLDAINIGKLTLNKLNTLQYAKANDKSTFASKQIVINKISFVKQNTLDIGNIKIDTPKAFLKKDEQALWLHNRLLPATGEKEETGKTEKAAASNNKKPASFTTTLGDISIVKPDFCFQDVNEKLDYCLTQKQSSWKGKITVNPVKGVLRINGNLNISATRINNPAIHSDLLRLQDISVDGIQINSADNIIVGKVALKQLLAMQREATPASYSMWFDSLLVDNIRLKHQDLLEINRINLKQPGLQLSKNKDGRWEHDKWLPI